MTRIREGLTLLLRDKDPKKAYREMLKRNKQRAKVMESDVSKAFLGNTRGKVAASGAGMNKGDNRIPLPHDSGTFYIECKTSEFVDTARGKGVPLQYLFFDKVVKETIAMGDRFGTLAIKYYGSSSIYLFFREEDAHIIQSIGGKHFTCNAPILNKTLAKTGKIIKNITVYEKHVKESFLLSESSGEVPHMRMNTLNSGVWILVHIDTLKELLGYA